MHHSSLKPGLIFALSTPPGRAALHLHRLSGPGALRALAPSLKGRTSGGGWTPLQPKNEAFTRWVQVCGADGQVIDDGVLSFFPGPRSYTGEDVVEFSSHGNPLLTALLHARFRQLGLRDAEPGEFTQRAWLNGRLDLAQAEAIHQLIHTSSQEGIRQARGITEGLLQEETERLKGLLVDALAFLEAHIDFAPDEVGEWDPTEALRRLQAPHAELKALLATFSRGLKAREGVKVALGGHPNAGKSSLYNALLRSERAIVTDIPGTTRDVLSEALVIQGRDFVLLDTAGVRETQDKVEKLGIGRSQKALAEADVALLMADVTKFIENESLVLKEWEELFSHVHADAKCFFLLNKCDLISPKDKEKALERLSGHWPHRSSQVVLCSESHTQPVVEILLRAHGALVGGESGNSTHGALLISERQRDAIASSVALVEEAQELLLQGGWPENAASLLNHCLHALVGLLGETSLDDVYDKIFSSFCIGK